MRNAIIQKIETEKIVAIVRGVESGLCLKVAEALYAGGIRLMEVTYDQKNPSGFVETAKAIGAIAKKFEGRMFVGAGTVTTPELVALTHEHGGQFIIAPDANKEVISATRALGLVSMPGALTPTEIMAAHNAGADFVKLFPAADFGPAYIKAVRAPISHVKLLAVGGINEKNMSDFLAAGVCGFGVGGNLANRAFIEAGEFFKISQAAESMVKAAQSR